MCGMRASGLFVNWNGPDVSSNRAALVDFGKLKRCENVEWSLLLLGEKPAAKLEDLDEEHLAWYQAHAAARGVFSREVLQSGGPGPEERGLAGAGGRTLHTLFLSWNEHAIDELVACEEAERKGGPARAQAQERSGILLGYPHCCARFMAGLERQDDMAVLGSYRPAAGGTARAAHKVLDFFPPLVSPLTWYPCSLHCTASQAKGKQYLAALARADQPRADRIRAALPGVVIAFSRFCFLHLHGAHARGEVVQFAGVSDALSYSGEPRIAHSPAVRAFRRTVTEVFARYRRVAIGADRILLHCGRGRTLEGQVGTAPLVVSFPGAKGGGLL